jgi:hypothetical protein
VSDIRFTISVYEYEKDGRAVADWREDDRFDVLTDLAMLLFPDVDVSAEGIQEKADTT